jgi:hypothetical protein
VPVNINIFVSSLSMHVTIYTNIQRTYTLWIQILINGCTGLMQPFLASGDAACYKQDISFINAALLYSKNV